MKHYINPENNQIFAYELDGSQDHLIAKNLQPISDAELAALRAPSAASVKANQIAIAKSTIQARLDSFAREKDYDSIISACSYAVSSTPAQRAEGQHCSDLRDLTWQEFYLILSDVDEGNRPMPSIEDLILELPELIWPTV